MITPIPKSIRSRGPSAFLSWNSGSSVSRIDCSMDLVRIIPIEAPLSGLSLDRQPQLEGIVKGNAATCLARRSEEHTSELQSRQYLVCRLLLEKKIKPT